MLYSRLQALVNCLEMLEDDDVDSRVCGCKALACLKVGLPNYSEHSCICSLIVGFLDLGLDSEFRTTNMRM